MSTRPREVSSDMVNPRNTRAVLLLIVTLVMMVLSVLTGVYLSSLVTEKRSVDDERFVSQAIGLAESGANHAVSEMRFRLDSGIVNNLRAVTLASTINSYATSNDSLGFLRDYCYNGSESHFAATPNVTGEMSVGVTPVTLVGNVEGNYANATIRVRQNGTARADLPNEDFWFNYTYTVESNGAITRYSNPISKQVVYSPQPFTIYVHRDNFAKFALFTVHHKTTNNTTVWFTNSTNFCGPVFTDERFAFANNPSAHFTENTSQNYTTAYFYNNSSSVLINASSNGVKDVPTFDKGFNRGADSLQLNASMTETQMRNYALGNGTDPGNGIWVINNGTACKGGIYVRGSSSNSSDDAYIRMTVDGSNNQVYTVNQGGANTTITINKGTNQTTVVNGTGTHIYTGVPDGTTHEGVLFFVNDTIKNVTGTVADTVQVTLASDKDMVLNGCLTYQNYTASPLSANNTTNLLGLISWNGNVRIGSGAPNNVSVDGIVMAPNGVFTVDSYDSGNSRGTATLLGGVISNYYGAFGTFGSGGDTGYGRNFVYDARMLEGSSPPYFPYMSYFTADIKPLNVLLQRMFWQLKEN